jgi:CRISPR-associated protein Cas2
MIVWVVYDIKNDRSRGKVAKACLQAGLYRVQYSVFLGSLDGHEKDSLKLRIEQEIDEARDSVYIFPMSRSELQQTDLLGQAFDKGLVTDEVKALFF